MTEQTRGGWDFSARASAAPGSLAVVQPSAAGRTPPPSNPPPTTGATASGGPGRRRSGGDTVRTVLRGIGQTMVTVGLVLLLFVVYEIWVSNVFAARKQDQVHTKLATAWKKGLDPLKGEDKLNLPTGKQVVLPAGEGFANLYIPHFGKDFARTIVQGTNDSDLELGPGHYSNSQLPGQVGNFALAGHRVGKGEPFLNLDQLHPGDSIVVQTASNWYVYKVLGNQKAYAAAIKLPAGAARTNAIDASLNAVDSQGVPGREIVSPSAIQVIAPVPDHPGTTPTRALLTLTTCHPKYTAQQRMIVHAVLSRAVPDQGSALPKELAGGTL